jgi:tetratricopeptide (TPR) repeat protein
MTENGSGRVAPTGQLLADNRWIVPILGVIGVVATFVTAGLVPTLVLLALLALFVIIALARSWRKADDRANELAAALAERGAAEDDAPEAGEAHDYRRTSTGSAVAEPPNDSTNDAEPKAEDDSDGPTWDALTKAVRERDVGASRQASAQYIDGAKDETDRIERQAFALRVRGWAGDTAALPDLEELVKAHPTVAAPALALAHSLEGMKEYRRASDILERAAESVEKSAHVLAEASRINRAARDFTKAQELSERALVRAGHTTEQAEARKALGWALWDVNHHAAAFTHWEAALHLNPADNDLRFAVAYRYSDTEVPELALLHYEVLVANDASHGSAQNNLGVVLESLGMEFAAAKNYRAAAERGESLPASNLASKFLSAGCADEVELWLAKGREADEVNPRVAQVEGQLALALESEVETRTATRHRAYELRKLFSDGLLPTDVPTGRWMLDGEEIELEPDGDEAAIERSTWGHRYRFARSPLGLEVMYQSSQYTSKQTGLGSLRDDELRFYLKSSTAGGPTTIVTGHPMADESPSPIS